ncbi:MAG TPA: vanadium-dependent haloperoxidase [Chloroflexota bacterium]
MKRTVRGLIAITLVTIIGLAPMRGEAAPANTTAVRDWNATAIATIAAAKLDGLAALRDLAIMHVAIYDAIQAVGAGSTSSQFRLAGTTLYGVPAAASPESAAAGAARTVLLSLIPSQRTTIDTAYATSLSQIPDSTAKSEGVLMGSWVGGKILAWRSGDNYNFPVVYSQPLQPGIFQTSAPSGAVSTFMPYVTPFVLQSASQFRAPPPPALTSAQYAADYNEVMSLGSINSTTRTADQTQIALFWFDDDAYMWNSVARMVAEQKQTTLTQDAKLFAELNVAMFDGLIGIFDSKYLYNFWRPEAAIHAGDTDGNPATAGDATWTPLRPTPAHPDYPSAHTSSGAAASTVLASFFGDATSFSFTTRTVLPANAVRSYTSFSQAATEEGVSRIYVGYHFRTAVNAGATMGHQTGEWTVKNFGSVVPAS